jgi:AraC-like DNA-binding protein
VGASSDKLMAYNHRKIVEKLEQIVAHKPYTRMNEIVSIIGLNRHTIKNAIRSTRQTSFREYRRRQLLKRAHVLLKDSDMSVSDIATSLGYGSSSTFIRFVHKSTGRSPGKLREDGILIRQ